MNTTLIVDSTSIMNPTDIYENYGYFTPLYNQQEPSSFQNFSSHEKKTVVDRESDFHCSIVAPKTEAPVVPSQFDPHFANNNGSSGSSCSIPSSPESVALLSSSPLLQLSFSTSMFPVNRHVLTCDDIAQRIPTLTQLPDALLPEFHQYSIESYRNNSGSNKKSRSQKHGAELDTSEYKRQVHIQSEQKRRAEIKEGFDTLRQHIPGCVNKKLSKATLLKRTVQHLQHLKKNQASILAELKKQVQENEMLKLKTTTMNE